MLRYVDHCFTLIRTYIVLLSYNPNLIALDLNTLQNFILENAVPIEHRGSFHQ